MSSNLEDRRNQEPDFTSFWCVMANVIQEQGHSQDTVWQGTKHFLPGETIAILDIYPNDNERIIVLGRHRETHHYIEIVMRHKWLTNFRSELLTHPVVIARLKKSYRVCHHWRWKGDTTKEECDALAAWLKSQHGQE